jgi:short-subunit dehydrogenase
VEILVNTADFVRPGGIISLPSFQDQRAMDDVIHLGLVRLARAFGPALMSRGSDGDHGAVAWVNILSVFALLPSASYGAYSAAHAAALSAARSLRSELRAGGVRVLNLFTGPTETEWFQEQPPPKVAPNQIGSAVAAGLRRGLEEIAVGDVANDLVERLLDNPKAAEREASAEGERA